MEPTCCPLVLWWATDSSCRSFGGGGGQAGYCLPQHRGHEWRHLGKSLSLLFFPKYKIKVKAKVSSQLGDS